MLNVADYLLDQSQPSVSYDYYQQAFFRNRGLVAGKEQDILRKSCVAIPGIGAMGSALALGLARLGVGKFRIADFDILEPVNTNRHFGTNTETLGRNKAEVVAEMIAAINPDVRITIFTEPVTDFNVHQFLDGADVVADGLDFFVPDTRALLCRVARQKQMYVVMGIPLGYGATLHTFSPKGMSFDDYFQMESGDGFEEKILTFLKGIAPKNYQKSYMAPEGIDFIRKRMPASGSASQLAAGLAISEISKILLKKKKVKAVPHYLHVDPFARKMSNGYLWRGNNHPLQQIKILLTKFSIIRKQGLVVIRQRFGDKLEGLLDRLAGLFKRQPST